MGRTLLVEHDANFRIAGLHGALDIGIAVIGLQCRAQLVGGALETVEVIPGKHYFKRCGEAEQARPRITVVRSRQIRQLFAQGVDGSVFVLSAGTGDEGDGQASGVFAGVHRVGIQAVASAGNCVRRLEVGQALGSVRGSHHGLVRRL